MCVCVCVYVSIHTCVNHKNKLKPQEPFAVFIKHKNIKTTIHIIQLLNSKICKNHNGLSGGYNYTKYTNIHKNTQSFH